MKPKYEIGQEIFWATFSACKSEYVSCPDCGGTARLRVTFHDETTVSIPCANCARGYEEPTGRIHVSCRKGEARKGRITGMEINNEKVEYKVEKNEISDDGQWYRGYYSIKEEDIFVSETEAQVKADQMAVDYDADERAKIFKKEKDSRSWAWNASYHRKEIKEAERRLEYHRKKLAHAAIKAKEDKHVTV